MAGRFEVSAIRVVRAAYPVCDPAAGIYDPVLGGPPFLPVLPSKSEVWVEGQSPPGGAAPEKEG